MEFEEKRQEKRKKCKIFLKFLIPKIVIKIAKN